MSVFVRVVWRREILGSFDLVLFRVLFGLLVVGFMYVLITIIISLLYQQYAHIQ